jgi:hypothetical protein
LINLIPESSSAPPAARKRYNRANIGITVLFLPVMLGTTWLGETGASPVLIAVGVVLTIGLIAALVYEFVRLMLALDELQNRIHVTALAIGFGAVTLTMLALGFIDVLLGFPNPGEHWPVLAILMFPTGSFVYYIALHLILRRYR